MVARENFGSREGRRRKGSPPVQRGILENDWDRTEVMSSTRQLSVWALLPLLVGLLVFSSSCSKNQNVEAREQKTSDAPTVAVAKATVESMSRQLVLTAEFKPYQEVDLM